MKTDKLTKVLLGVIAIALWMLALNPWLQPVPVAAQVGVSFQCTGSLEAKYPATARSEGIVRDYSIRLYCD